MAWGITRSAPVHPAIASRRQSADRHHERSGSISRSRLMAVPATPAPSWIVLSEYQRKTVVYPLRQLLEPPFTRVERAILQIDERSHVQRLLVTQAALVAHRHVGPDESGQFLDVAESRASVKGVQAPYGGNRALTFAFCAMANSTHALVDGLPAR